MENKMFWGFFSYRIFKSFYGFTGRNVISRQMSEAGWKCLYKKISFLLFLVTRNSRHSRGKIIILHGFILPRKPPQVIPFAFSKPAKNTWKLTILNASPEVPDSDLKSFWGVLQPFAPNAGGNGVQAQFFFILFKIFPLSFCLPLSVVHINTYINRYK